VTTFISNYKIQVNLLVSKNLGIREVKANLSSLLKKVKEGQEIIITDRGKPIGKIVPFPVKDFSLENRIQFPKVRYSLGEIASLDKYFDIFSPLRYYLTNSKR
jgi:prevent-host-death family protein